MSSQSGSASSSSSSSSAALSSSWEMYTLDKSRWEMPLKEVEALGYTDPVSAHENVFREWNASLYPGVSKLYATAYNNWTEDVRQSQALAPDGRPFNDNPAPALQLDGTMCENQNMLATKTCERVFGRDHIVAFGQKFIIFEGEGNTQDEWVGQETHLTYEIDKWPSLNSQALMCDLQCMNYHESEVSQWTCNATVVSTNVTGNTYMSHLHTNSVHPGQTPKHLVQWINAKGSVVDEVASTEHQCNKIISFGRQVLHARHGSDPILGDDNPTTIVFLGTTFNEKMISMMHGLSKSIKVQFGDTSVKMPRVCRIIVVHPRGFTKQMHDALFGSSGVFKGRQPVRQFSDIYKPKKEMEVVVFPVTLHEFWSSESDDTFPSYGLKVWTLSANHIWPGCETNCLLSWQNDTPIRV